MFGTTCSGQSAVSPLHPLREMKEKALPCVNYAYILGIALENFGTRTSCGLPLFQEFAPLLDAAADAKIALPKRPPPPVRLLAVGKTASLVLWERTPPTFWKSVRPCRQATSRPSRSRFFGARGKSLLTPVPLLMKRSGRPGARYLPSWTRKRVPPRRGEVWLFDRGMTAKTRPVLVVSVRVRRYCNGDPSKPVRDRCK